MMKMSRREKYLIAFVTLTILSLACSSQVTVFETPSPPNVETLVAGTVISYTENAPKATTEIISTRTSIPQTSPTAEKFGEVYVYTVVSNVNLRTQPGTLFQVSRVMPQDTRLRLIGQAPGGEWLKVRNDEGIEGWVNVNVVLVANDGPPPPIVEPTDVYLVTGQVLTEVGTPVSGAGFAIIQGDRRTDAFTDEKGQFYAYLPRTLSGMWQVDFISISCKSNTMDSNCNCINSICGTANPETGLVELPQIKELKFIWK